jgi:hypothetical protein
MNTPFLNISTFLPREKFDRPIEWFLTRAAISSSWNMAPNGMVQAEESLK